MKSSMKSSMMSSMMSFRAVSAAFASLAAAACIAPAFAGSTEVAYTDSQGREWRQVNLTANFTWSQIAGVCPTDGVTPCSGSLGSVSMNGWVWATREQVVQLFAEFSPAVSKTGQVAGPQYFNPAFGFLFGTFVPTMNEITPFYINLGLWGWTASSAGGNKAYIASSLATTTPQNGIFSAVNQELRGSASSSRGAWLYRSTAPACPADLNQDGAVGPADLATLLNSWGTAGPGDLNGSGTVDAQDLAAMLASWGGC